MSDSFFAMVVLPIIIAVAICATAILWLPPWGAVAAVLVVIPIAALVVLGNSVPRF